MRESSTDEELARQLDLDLPTFAGLFGSPWQGNVATGAAAGRRASRHDLGTWHVTGEPPQLMLQVTCDEVHMARPRGQWTGGGEPVLVPADPCSFSVRNLDHAAIRIAAADLVRRRRASFSYCRICRSLTPPEFMERADGACMSCASRWLGVVY